MCVRLGFCTSDFAFVHDVLSIHEIIREDLSFRDSQPLSLLAYACQHLSNSRIDEFALYTVASNSEDALQALGSQTFMAWVRVMLRMFTKGMLMGLRPIRR